MKKNIQIFCIACLCFSVGIFAFVSREGSVKPGKMKSGVALYSFNRFSFLESLEKADSAGAEYVEGFFFHKLGEGFNGNAIPALSDAEISKMKGMLDKKGLKMKSLYAGNGKNRQEWIQYFDFAKKMGIEFFSCEPERKDWDLLDSLAGAYKMKIAIHEHAKGSSYYWHPDSVVAAMKGHPNFGACADLGHWSRSGLDPVKCLQTLKGKVIAVHVKDLDAFDNLKANDVVAGTGVLKYPDIIKELNRQNFSGIAYVEREGNWANNTDDVRRALKLLADLNK